MSEQEIEFRNSVFRHIEYPKDLLQEFFDYWTEPNKSGTKMRWQMERTWDLNRRLKRWAGNNFGKGNPKPGVQVKAAPPKTEPQTEVERLDKFLDDYRQHPSAISFESFGTWYEFMKEHKLLKSFTVGEVEDLKKMYNNDRDKCRCACVQITLTGYANNLLRISDIMKMRQQLV